MIAQGSNIAIRQFEKLYSYYLLKILKGGRVPTISDVMAFAGEELPQISGEIKPIYSYIPQTSDSVFDITLYNNSLDKIKFDLEILFEEIESIEVNNLGRIMHADLFHAANSYELNRISATLDALLFAVGGADQAFHAQFETFSSLEKTNIEESTQNIVDLSEGVIALPMLGAGTMRIDMSHLQDVSSVPIEIQPPNLSVASTVPESSFGNILKDSSGVWAVIIESDVNEPVSITFSFALPREERINRITMIPHSIKKQKAYVRYSVDNVNIRDIPEYLSGVDLTSPSSVVSVDFEERLVEYFHVTLEKQEADDEIESGEATKYQYIFGLKNFSAWIGGRNDKATYVSKPFQFKDDLAVIGKAAISAAESIPENTQINWSIAFVDESDTPLTPFVQIKPQNHPDESGPPKIIITSESLPGSTFFSTANADNVNLFVFNSIQFRQLFIADDEPIFGTGKLLRGKRAWTRNIEGQAEAVLVKDNFIDFAEGTTQNLYVVSTESTTLVLNPEAEGTLQASLSKPIVASSFATSFLATGGVGISADANATPNFSIYTATMSLGSGGSGSQVIDPADWVGLIYNVGTPAIDAGSVSIVKRVIDTGDIIRTYISGIDFIVDTDAGYPTGNLLASAEGPFDSASDVYDPPDEGEEWQLNHGISADITRFIIAISASTILFDDSFSILYNGEAIYVKYRHFADNVVKASLVAKSELGPPFGGTIVYTQGTDYIFDSNTNAVQRLPSGTIPINTPVYIDYSYEIPSNLQEYTVWCKIEDPDGVQFNLKKNTQASSSSTNDLSPNTAAGEALFVSVAGIGIVEITEAIEMPLLKGWVQFIVQSLSPFVLDANGDDIVGTKVPVTPLIDQVIALEDDTGSFVFVEGGKYFSEIVASRQPLAQVSLPFLKTNVLKAENTYFAVEPVIVGIETKYSLVVNYVPNTQINIYSYAIDLSGEIPSVIQIPEEYIYNWVSKTAVNPSTGVIIKTELSRKEDAPGNATPKVSSFFVKVSY